jgi:hypothetical protein
MHPIQRLFVEFFSQECTILSTFTALQRFWMVGSSLATSASIWEIWWYNKTSQKGILDYILRGGKTRNNILSPPPFS